MKAAISIFIATIFLFSIFTYAFVDIHIPYLHFLFTGFYLDHRHMLTAIYFFFTLVLYGCFYYIVNRSIDFNYDSGKITFLIIVSTIFSYPAALTFDIFNYLTTAKVVFHYHENPYVVYPIEFINEPYLLFTRAANKLALYGPFWILLTSIPYFLGFGNFILTVFSFKAFVALFYILTVYLIKKMDKRAVLFFALNPLVIIETLISSHNDIVMVFFVLLSIHLLHKEKTLSIISYIGSILIKFSTLFLLPAYIFVLMRKTREEAVYLYGAISMLVIFLLSPLREELYPWYAIWVIAFTAFLHKNKMLQSVVIFLSLGLALRYIPYMATGNYFGPTPMIKIVLTILPISVFLVWSIIKKQLKNFIN